MTVALIWIATATGVAAMAKIEPHNRTYPIYAVTVATLFTIVTYLS